MKKILLAAVAALSMTACQESLEDRAAREAWEYTRKNCPRKVSDMITNDSLTFDKSTRTLHYYMTVSGAADTTAIRESQLRHDMIEGLKGTTSVRNYKDAGFNFMYTFYSTKHPGTKTYEINITPKDYK